MRLYLDDDIVSLHLPRLLRRAGHEVQLPADVGLIGKDDSVHLAHAVRDQRACLSKNYGDFENLHDLVQAVRGQHAGILVVREDNDPQRDMKPGDIVRAIGKVTAAGVPIANEYTILNNWR